MKKIVIAVSLVFAASAQASEEVTMLEVEMTPIVKQAPKKTSEQQSDERFANYVLENSASTEQ